ncbi:hypothetical protein PPH41_37190, partial [Burkholderia gladioli]|nr:hypothetical protein [Burkholderia gladioli]
MHADMGGRAIARMREHQQARTIPVEQRGQERDVAFPAGRVGMAARLADRLAARGAGIGQGG